MKFFTIFFLLLGALGASGHGFGLTCSDGYIFLGLGAVLFWVRYGRRFVRQAIAEGRQKEAEAVRRYREKAYSAPVGRFSEYCPEEIEEKLEAPSAVELAAEAEPEAVEVDYDPFCRYADNLPKEKERLECVLWGLYSKRDKYEFMGKSHNTQAWKGLEWDIGEIERRLEALKAV